MNNPGKPLKEWFGYNRRERRATLILTVIVLLVFSFRFVVPENGEEPSITLIDTEPSSELPDSLILISARTASVPAQKQQKKLIIELNLCDSAELVKLPGIGPVFSGRIVKFRSLLGGFADKMQLREVYGMPEETYSIISTMVTADTSLLKKIEINSCEYRDLIRHPYLSPEDVKSILNYRKLMGRIENWSTIMENNLLTGEKRDFLRYYFSYN